MVEFESSLELDLICRLDVDPTVLWFESQPLKVRYTDRAGRWHSYTPDLLIRYLPRPGFPEHILCEVKFFAELAEQWTELKPKLAAAGEYAQSKHWAFEVHSEYEIRTDSLWNAKVLWEYCRRPALAAYQSEVLKIAARLGDTTVSDFISRFDCLTPELASEYIVAFYQLVARGLIKADLDKRLTDQSRVWQ